MDLLDTARADDTTEFTPRLIAREAVNPVYTIAGHHHIDRRPQ
ncbi:hypothetical protein ACIA8C_09755 [Nocardia sp. NPDC051321]